jgi:hypothetical protein
MHVVASHRYRCCHWPWSHHEAASNYARSPTQGGTAQASLCVSPFTPLHIYAHPQHLVIALRYRAGAIRRFWPYGTSAMQDCGYGLPRTPLFLGTWVNKGMTKGRGS